MMSGSERKRKPIFWWPEEVFFRSIQPYRSAIGAPIFWLLPTNLLIGQPIFRLLCSMFSYAEICFVAPYARQPDMRIADALSTYKGTGQTVSFTRSGEQMPSVT